MDAKGKNQVRNVELILHHRDLSRDLALLVLEDDIELDEKEITKVELPTKDKHYVKVGSSKCMTLSWMSLKIKKDKMKLAIVKGGLNIQKKNFCPILRDYPADDTSYSNNIICAWKPVIMKTCPVSTFLSNVSLRISPFDTFREILDFLYFVILEENIKIF